MTLEEKAKMIKENKEKNYLYISPKIIQGGMTLIYDYESLELYEEIEENTQKFADEIITNLISQTNENDPEVRDYIKLNLIFCGDFDELPNKIGDFSDFIKEYKHKIVAIHKYVKDIETREYFIGFAQTETINKYGYLYLDFNKLLSLFEEHNVQWEVDKTIDRFTPSLYKDDRMTKFILHYKLK